MVCGLVVVNSCSSLLAFQRMNCIAFIIPLEERRGEERVSYLPITDSYFLFPVHSIERYAVVIHVVFVSPSLVKHLYECKTSWSFDSLKAAVGQEVLYKVLLLSKDHELSAIEG